MLNQVLKDHKQQTLKSNHFFSLSLQKPRNILRGFFLLLSCYKSLSVSSSHFFILVIQPVQLILEMYVLLNRFTIPEYIAGFSELNLFVMVT